MWVGAAYALVAGLTWGLVFVAPLLLPDYPAAQLMAGRYLAFGLIALPLARREIDAVNHRWLSEALKRKAAQIGEVQRIEQNDAERTLTISIKI